MLLAIIKLMRLYYSLPFAAGFIVILAYLTGNQLHHILDKLIISTTALFAIIAAGYVLNDICDIETDKINCPSRILAAGKLKKKPAIIFSIFLFTAGLILAAICGFMFFLGIATITAMLIFYDLFSKRIGIAKDILVAILMTSLYPLAFTLAEPAQTPRLNVLFIHPLWIFLSTFGYEILKDIRDVKGDTKINAPKINYYQKKWVLTMAQLSILTASLITLLPFILGYCKQIYLAASIAAIILAILSTFNKPIIAIRCVYAEIFIITAGSMVDLLVFGP